MRALPPLPRRPAPRCACGRSISAPCSRFRAGCRSASGRRSGRPTGWSTWRASRGTSTCAAEPQAEVLPGPRRRRRQAHHRGRPARRHRCCDEAVRRGVRRRLGQERNIADPKVLDDPAVECGLPARRIEQVAEPDRAGALRGLHAAGDRRPACSARRATSSTARSSGGRIGSISSQTQGGRL